MATRTWMTRRAIMGGLTSLATIAMLGAQPAMGQATAPAANAPQPPMPAQARPNIVVFLADDLGLLDTSPYGSRDARTPNLDKLASEGQLFERAFVASPACAPSRAALLTGLMPARNGSEVNQQAPVSWVRKLPSYLQEQGYEVVAFGKVSHYKQTAMYGFDHFEHDTFHDPDGVPAAVEWLKNRKSTKPLAIFVGSNWPHVPWPKTTEGYDPAKVGLPDKSVDTPITRNARARFLAAVTRLDTELGQVMTASDAALGPNTFVLFSSDHGTQWPFGKWDLYDTGIQIPMIVRWRGHVAPKSRNSAMVSWVDILPTLVDVAGGKTPVDLDGKSFAGVLSGATPVGRSEIFTTHTGDGRVNVYPMRSVRTDRFKYIRNLHPDWTYTTHIDQFVDRVDSGAYWPSWLAAAEKDKRAKQIVDSYYTRPAEELYDVIADPAEKHNLAGDSRYASTLSDLRKRVDQWMLVQGDTMRPAKGPPHLDRSRTATD